MEPEKLYVLADKISKFNNAKVVYLAWIFGTLGFVLSIISGYQMIWFWAGITFLTIFLIVSKSIRYDFTRRPFRVLLTIFSAVYVNQLAIDYTWLYIAVIFAFFFGNFFPHILRLIANIIQRRSY